MPEQSVPWEFSILAFRELGCVRKRDGAVLSLYFQHSNFKGKLCHGFELYIWFGLFDLIEKQVASGLDKNFPQIMSRRPPARLKPNFFCPLIGTAKAVPSRFRELAAHESHGLLFRMQIPF